MAEETLTLILIQFPSFLAPITSLGHSLLKLLFEYDVLLPRLPCQEEAQGTEAVSEAWWPTVPEEHNYLDFLAARVFQHKP